jgi:phosphoglycolate phosphatase
VTDTSAIEPSPPHGSGPLAGATIVFDLDGTLVETAPDLMGTLNVLLQREGVAPLPLSQARSLIGAGAKALLARGFAVAGQPLEEPRLSILFDDFIAYYLAHIADESRPFEGVIAAMDVLEAGGARLAVCTNKRTDLSLALLDALGLTRRFAAVVGGDAAPAQKPDPRHLTTTIERAGGRLDRAVMVGDSASDARAAQAAGVPLVLVSFGYTDIPAAELGADVVIDHFEDLPAACARLLATPAAAPNAANLI